MRYTILLTRKTLESNSHRCAVPRHCDKNIIFFSREAKRLPDKRGTEGRAKTRQRFERILSLDRMVSPRSN